MPVIRVAPFGSGLIRLVVAVALVAALPLAVDTPLTPPAQAANFVVNLASDPGDGTCDASCTLRDAILGANALAGADTITFSGAITTPIVLASALPAIAQPLTIDGSGQNVTVDGANAFRVFFATAPLTLTALTVQHGRGPNDGFGGGGAYFGSTGTLSSVNFISNTALALSGAGGAYFASHATVSGGSFISNTATGNGANGGGAYVGGAAVISGTAFMTNTAVIGNGGGLYVFGTSALTNTTFISNTAAANGGGVYAFGAASVAGSTFERNRAASIFSSSGGGVAFTAGGSLANSSFISNMAVLSGGGVNSSGALAVSDSTFTGNASGNGGGAYLATGALTNTQFISNNALSDGGGLWLGTATLATAQATDDGDIAPITGATFTGNASINGGGAYLSGPAAISGSTFNGNSAVASGGGLQTSSATTITASSFTTNTAGSHGGGLYALGAITLTATRHYTNSAGGSGGGAYFTGPASIQAGTFFSNTAGGDGGGAKFDQDANVTQSDFSNNATTGFGTDGGGAFLGGGGSLTESTFDGNTAQNGNGGGIFGSGLTLKDLVISGNQAQCDDEQQRLLASPQATHDELCGNGGGAYLSGSGQSENSHFLGNQADGDGGGAYLSNGALVGYDLSLFRENVAGEEGGGAYLSGLSGNWRRIQFSENEAGNDGGALYLNQSHLDINNALWSTNRTVNPDGAVDIGMSLNNAFLNAEHVTYAGPSLAVFHQSVSVGTALPDEHGQQDQVATITNAIFHGYDVAVQGKVPTSTISLEGVLWSSIDTPVQTGNFQLNAQYFGDADFVNAAGGDYHLGPASAALDRGLPTQLTVDLDGLLRQVGAAPDLGAYERQTAQPPRIQFYVPLVNSFDF